MHSLRQVLILFAWVSVCLLCPAGSMHLSAQSDSRSFAFLNLPVSARLTALGGTNVATRDGELSFMLRNPALLSEATDKVLSLNYANLMTTENCANVLYAHNYHDNRFGGAVHYVDYGKMAYADELGGRTGQTFSARDILIQLTYARQLGRWFTVGASLKPVISVYGEYSSFSLGADVGGHFQTRDSSFHLGISLQNIGWQLKTFYPGARRDMLPLNLQLGLSYRFRHAPLRLGMTIHDMQCWNLNYQLTNQPRTSTLSGETAADQAVPWYDMLFRHTVFSIEVVPKSERFWLAVSYNHRMRQEMHLKDQRSMAGFAVGAGLRLKQFRLAYAFTMYQKGQFVHQASLSMNINEFLK
ncbi:MAG: type IX secretion system protein PorQ [Paludibacteraceae bacterium]|nr:type IX secretion system protein PorQ [Paludibacteraceae bacterium]